MHETSKLTASFNNDRGESLAGIVDLPRAKPHAWAIFAHCFTCSKEIVTTRRICKVLAENGIAVLRFDFTGLGDSEGVFSATSFTTNIADLKAAAKYLAENHQAPRLLIGHSLGGAAVMAAARDIESVTALVTINSPSDPSHLNHVFAPYVDEINLNGSATVPIVGRDFLVKKHFIDDLQIHQLESKIRRINKPILILHTPGDEIVHVDEARKIFTAARHPKSFVSLDAADHLLTAASDAAYTANLISCWASRYIQGKNPEANAETRPAVAEGEVVVRETGENYRNEIFVRDHQFIVDEPIAVGGQDLGPKPTELVLAALGSCTTITLRMYAEHKGWKVGGISARLTKNKPAKGEQHEISMTLEIDAQLDADQIKRMKAIANRCPVYQLLMGDIEISHELVIAN